MAEGAPGAVKTLLADMAASWLRLADMVEQWDAKYEAGKAAPTGGPRGRRSEPQPKGWGFDFRGASVGGLIVPVNFILTYRPPPCRQAPTLRLEGEVRATGADACPCTRRTPYMQPEDHSWVPKVTRPVMSGPTSSGPGPNCEIDAVGPGRVKTCPVLREPAVGDFNSDFAGWGGSASALYVPEGRTWVAWAGPSLLHASIASNNSLTPRIASTRLRL